MRETPDSAAAPAARCKNWRRRSFIPVPPRHAIRWGRVRIDLGLSSVEQDDSRDQVHRGKKISSEFIISRGDPSVMLDFVPETLGEITLAVERKIAVAPLLSVFP